MCRNRPRGFALRVREVSGFRLDNVPRAKQLSEPLLPPVVPVIFHGSSRRSRFPAPAICVPLYSVIARQSGDERYADSEEVARAFRFKAGTPLILTGTDKDRPLERWWSLGPARVGQIRRLCELGVELVTTPNFSLFTDQPRWDDLHSMKRIAITHEEFLREGLPAALHVNGRTERDWERWTEYICRRIEITHLAFEFRTGSGWAGRMRWHANNLANLARSAGRPIHLVVRAAAPAILPTLAASFETLTVLDTTSFVKAVYRQRAIESATGTIKWKTSLTAVGEPLDELLSHNWSVVSRGYHSLLSKSSNIQAAA